MAGAVWSSGRPALSSTWMFQRASSAATRRVNMRSGEMRAALSCRSIASRKAIATLKASSASLRAVMIETPSRASALSVSGRASR